MKTVIIFCLSSLLSLSAWAGTFSGYAPTNALSPDLLLLDSRISAGVYATRTTTLSNLLLSPAVQSMVTTNQAVMNFTIYPSNIITITMAGANIFSTNGQRTFNGSLNCFAGMKAGYGFVIGTDQYVVEDVPSANQIDVFEPSSISYTNITTWTIYPTGARLLDITSNLCGWFCNGGQLGIMGNTSTTANGCFMDYDNGLHSFRTGTHPQFDGYRWGVGNMSSTLGIAYALDVNESAPAASIWVLPDGAVSFITGITNYGATLQIKGQVNITNGASMGGTLSQVPTNVTSAATFTTTNGSFGIVAASGTFANIVVGTQLALAGESGAYTVCQVIDSTHLILFEPLTATVTGGAVTTIYKPIQAWNNFTPVPAGAISAGGDVITLGPDSGSGARTIWAMGAHSFSAQVANQSGVYRWELRSSKGAGGSAFSVDESAPFNSVWVLANAVTAVQGLTNFSGPVPIYGGLTVNATINATNVTVPGTVTAGTYVNLPYRAGQATMATSGTNVAVTFSTALPSTNYSITLAPLGQLGNIGLGYAAKTVNGFNICYTTAIGTSNTFVTWQAWMNQ